MSETSQNLEKLISSLGGRGRFQTTIHLLVSFAYILLSFNNVVNAIYGSSIPHRCMAGTDVQIGPNTTSLYNNSSSMNAQPYVTNITHSQCHSTLFYSDGQEEVIQCSAGQWEYFPKYGEKNLVSEFDLVCSHEYMVSLATTIYFVGVMMGGLVFGDLADMFGRLPIFLFTMYGCIGVAFVNAFAVNYAMFVCFRFLNGFLIQGLQNSAYSLCMEMYQAKLRPYAGVVVELFFGVGVMGISALAYCLPYWRHLQMAMALIPVFTVFYPWVVPESLRWLVTKGKLDQAENQLRRICKTNQIPSPTETWNLLKQTGDGQMQAGQRRYNLTHLFRDRFLMEITLISSYIWFVMSLSYYGLLFKITTFKGNFYLNFFISGVLEIVTYSLCLLVMNRFGRKKPLMAGFVVAAVLCLASGFIAANSQGLDHVVTVFGLCGKCLLATVFVMMFVYTSEVYPTVVRVLGLGMGMVWARLGAVAAPQVNHWVQALLGFDVFYIFGILSLSCAMLVFFLPETHKKHLPDTINDRRKEKKRNFLKSGGGDGSGNLSNGRGEVHTEMIRLESDRDAV